MFLLNDDNGNIVQSLEMEHQRNPERIMNEVFKRWIAGTGKRPISWDTLIAVLKDVELNTLADELQDVLF